MWYIFHKVEFFGIHFGNDIVFNLLWTLFNCSKDENKKMMYFVIKKIKSLSMVVKKEESSKFYNVICFL